MLWRLAVALLAFVAMVAGSKRVVVTGAAGKTGNLVLKKLCSSKLFDVVGLVRTSSSLKKLSNEEGLSGQLLAVDVTDETNLHSAFQGADYAVLCTSAVPKLKWWSLIKVFFFKLIGRKVQPDFYFARGGDPYYVDWIGAKNQIDAAVKAGVQHFVFVSFMGGTKPDHFLNTLGRTDSDPKSGNILKWKRMAEEYLISSGLPYTIIHPGGLTDKAGGEGEIVLGVDDALMEGTDRSIPRADVADVIVAALDVGAAAQNRSFDIVSRARSTCSADDAGKQQEATQQQRDWEAFFAQPGNCKY